MNKKEFFQEEEIRISMQTKLRVLFLLVGIIPLMILGYMAFNDQKEVIKGLIIDSSSEIGTVLAEELNDKITTSYRMLKSTAKIPSLQEKVNPEIETILRSNLHNFKIFRKLYFLDSNGSDGIGAINKNGFVKVQPISQIKEIDPNVVKYWYIGTVRGQNVKEGFYSDVYFDPETKEPVQLMGVYVKDDIFNTVGILIAELKLTELWPIVDRIGFGKLSKDSSAKENQGTGFAFVIDEKTGRLIAHSNKNYIEENNGKYEKLGNTRFLTQNEINTLKSFGKGGSTILQSHTNVKKLLSYVSTKAISKVNDSQASLVKLDQEEFDIFTPDWGVIIEQTEKEAFAPAKRLMIKIILIIIIGIFLSIFLAVLFAHGITRSMKTLHLGALNISNGDLSQELIIDSGDEIGELAKAFDKMRINLKKKINDLKILYDMSQSISAILDYKDLLNKIITTTIQVLDAEKGSIMLYDDETEMLKIEASHGLPEDLSGETLINPNKGIVGWVIRTGKPLLIKDTLKEAGFEKMKGRKAESGTLLSAPLKVKDKLLGVINVSKSVPNIYTENDKELFAAIALQAAIAIEKAILYRMAITDGLTKLYIHRYFQQRFDEELKRAIRYKKPLSFIMFDIDHFKNFNDTYGHQVGDRVLKTVARIIEKSVRDVDIPARYGGEEFAVILPDQDCEMAMTPTERIRKNIQDYPFYVEDKRVQITVSLGVSGYPEHSEDKTELIEFADTALYISKESGRNQTSIFTPDMPKKLEELKKGNKE